MHKLRFVGLFLFFFALLAVLSDLSGAPKGWGYVLRGAASFLQPVLTGWHMEVHPERQPTLWLVRGGQSLPFQFGLEKWALSLLPFLSLVIATPVLSLTRRASVAALGIGAMFVLDLIIILLYPTLVVRGAITDIVGTFLGLLTFVGAPVILWFALTFRELSSVWRFEFPTPTTARSKP